MIKKFGVYADYQRIAKISEIARTTLRERHLDGIQIAKIKGKYKEADKLDHPNP